MPAGDPKLVALGRATRQLREKRGMTTATLAIAADLDRDLVEAIEKGRHDPHYDVMLALADGLGVGLAVVVRRSERPDGDEEAT